MSIYVCPFGDGDVDEDFLYMNVAGAEPISFVKFTKDFAEVLEGTVDLSKRCNKAIQKKPLNRRLPYYSLTTDDLEQSDTESMDC